MGTDGKFTARVRFDITAFTVAHSITLALTALGVISLPGRVIEPIIAISIAFVAIENLTTREVRPWRTAVVFLFGLVHGMGFAEVFRNAGLSGGGLLAAKDPRHRPYIVVPGSLLIAAVALFWTAQRAFGIGV